MKKLFVFVSILFVCSFISAKEIKLTITPGENFKETFEPQSAVWLEDTEGNYVKTLYATKKASKKSWIFGPKEGRPEALPVWYNASKISAKKSHKVKNNVTTQVDAVTTATPKKSISFYAEIEEKNYVIKAEFNNSFDNNDYYTKKIAGANGQPSIVYAAEIPEQFNEDILFSIVGIGSLNGKDGDIQKDISHLTTAKKIVKNIVCSVKN